VSSIISRSNTDGLVKNLKVRHSGKRESFTFYETVNTDGFVKSRHSGENRSPETLQLIEITGFRLSPE